MFHLHVGTHSMYVPGTARGGGGGWMFWNTRTCLSQPRPDQSARSGPFPALNTASYVKNANDPVLLTAAGNKEIISGCLNAFPVRSCVFLFVINSSLCNQWPYRLFTVWCNANNPMTKRFSLSHSFQCRLFIVTVQVVRKRSADHRMAKDALTE